MSFLPFSYKIENKFILPHNKKESDVNFDMTIDDNGYVTVSINISEKIYLSRQKMKLFHAPLHTTPSVLVDMNIKDYVVSAKLDGIFSALYIDNSGIGYYLYPLTRRLYKIGKTTNKNHYNIICNGELIEKDFFGKEIQPYLVLFDILEWKGNVLTNDLSHRVNICKSIINYFEINEKSVFKFISVKSYVPIKSIYRVISSKLHRKDGIIFTLKRGKPGIGCIRWKPLPTITMGLDYDSKENDYRIYFSDKNYRNQFRKRYYDIYKRSYTIHNSSSSYLFKDILTHENFNKFKNYIDNNSIDNILVELFIDKDPFNLDSYGVFEFMRFRDDKKYPDNIENVNDILNLMYNPVRLDELLGKKSIYNYWLTPSKKAHLWVKYSKSVKKIIYERWSTYGKLLDLCSGRGSDTMLLYGLSKKKSFTEIHCLEKDDMQLDALFDFTTMIRNDNLSGMNCNISIKKGDINDPKLSDKYVGKFDTIICSNAIQFAMDPYEEQYGLRNISSLLRENGILIIIFMDGDVLEKSFSINCEYNNCKYNNCKCNNCENGCVTHFTRYNHIIVDADNEIKYCNGYICSCYESRFNPLESYKNDLGLFYTYEESKVRRDNTYYDPSHIWVKLPTAFNTVREPIVGKISLIRQLQNHGFCLIETNKFKDIKESKNKLASIYSYAIFRNTSNCKLVSPFFLICEDVFYCILDFLKIIDVFSLGQTHRLFTDICLRYMKMEPIAWTRLYNEISENNCEEDISCWT